MRGFINLELTDEHIQLIKNMLVKKLGETTYGVDQIGLLGGNLALEDTARILGYANQRVKGTEEDADGAAYPEDVEEHLWNVYSYVSDNLYYIETLVHQMVCQGGITPGMYKARRDDLIWVKC